MNISENKRLVPSIAEQLIIELFAGQTKELNEIKTKVEEVHAERGGLPYTSKYHPVQLALTKLKNTGVVENPQLGYWSIQSNEDTRIKTLGAFIKWANNFKEDEFVFRGVPNEAYKIQASAYRRPAENERNFEKFLYVNKDLISKAKQRGYDKDKKDGTVWNELDILVELQHFKTATCLIDFSFSAQVALWFACQPVQKKKGENGEAEDNKKPPNAKVSAVQIRPPKFIEITPEFWERGDNEEKEVKKKIDYFLKEDKKSDLYYLQPKFQNNRIIAQQSVFLFGQYEIDADDECVIAEESKKDILIELQRVSGITEDKLFPDFEGFAWVHREESLYTEPTPTALKEQGNRAFENEEYEVAIGDFSRAIEKASNDVESYNLRGKAYTRLEYFGNALADFTEAEKIDPDDAETYFNRGNLYQQQGQYQDAINDYDTAITKKEDYGEAFYRRGLVNYQLNQHEEAVNDFTEAIRFMPNYAYAYYWRGYVKYHVDREEEALTDFIEAIRLKPDYADAYFYSGLIKYEFIQFEPAILDFDKAIELNPNNEEALFYRAEAKRSLKRFSEAKQDIEVALELALQNDNDMMVSEILILLNEIDSRIAMEEDDE